jgi:ParB-like chromosome segregation protein Spo0J
MKTIACDGYESVESIYVPVHRRSVDEKTVTDLMSSIKDIGLRTPITLLYVKDLETPDEGIIGNAVMLVAGRNRLEAVTRLGWESVPFNKAPDLETAQMWEVAENLHRRELVALERKELIAKWIRLRESREVSAQLASKSQRRAGRPESGINAAARDLGIDRTEAQRAMRVANIEPAAKTIVRAAGLADNQSVLLTVAKAAPEDQVAKIREIAAERGRTWEDADVEDVDSLFGPATVPAGRKFFASGWFSLTADERRCLAAKLAEDPDLVNRMVREALG